MKKVKIVILVTLLIVSLLMLGCNNPDKGDISAEFEGFTKVSDDAYSIVLANSSYSLDLSSVVKIDTRSSWKLSSDASATNIIENKIAALSEGDNTYFVIVTAQKSEKQTYTLTIRRRPLYLVTFDTDGGSTVSSQNVEEGELAVRPDLPKKIGHTASWEFDFSEAITEETIISVKWTAIVFLGDGSESEPYIISSSEQLVYFSHLVNTVENYSKYKYFTLSNDIDLNNEEFNPVGLPLDREFNPNTDNKYAFSGYFDGCGYTVSNFKITGEMRCVGLFRYNAGDIKNLDIKNFSIVVSSAEAGGLVGYNLGDGTITNCYSSGIVSCSSNYSAYYGESYALSSGLVAINYGTINACNSDSIVSSVATSNSRDSAYAYAGGLVGTNYGIITASYVIGKVSSSSTATSSFCRAYAGGLAASNYATITNSYSTSTANSKSTSAASADSVSGSLVAYNDSTITNCYTIGVSDSTSTHNAFAGGLIGYGNTKSDIIHCYVLGNISATVSSGSAFAGGIIGYNVGKVNGCYRYENQIISITKNSITTTVPSNTLGDTITNYDLDSDTFYTATLKWSMDIWNLSNLDFESGIYPTLNAVV